MVLVATNHLDGVGRFRHPSDGIRLEYLSYLFWKLRKPRLPKVEKVYEDAPIRRPGHTDEPDEGNDDPLPLPRHSVESAQHRDQLQGPHHPVTVADLVSCISLLSGGLISAEVGPLDR
jgi:hypothetical protein